MDNQRWRAGIIGAVRGGLGLFALFALLLTLFAGAVVFSNTSEPAKLCQRQHARLETSEDDDGDR